MTIGIHRAARLVEQRKRFSGKRERREGGRSSNIGGKLWPYDGADDKGNAAAEAIRTAVHAQFGILVIVCEAREYAVASNVEPPFVVDFRKKINRKNQLLNSFGTTKARKVSSSDQILEAMQSQFHSALACLPFARLISNPSTTLPSATWPYHWKPTHQFWLVQGQKSGIVTSEFDEEKNTSIK